MKDLIRKASLETGFFAFGVASAKPDGELEHLEQWLSKNYNGTMYWMRRNPKARCDPKSLLSEAKSVICAAFEYGEDGVGNKISPDPLFSKGGRGDSNKARFARGRDYHKAVREKLEGLWGEIKRHAPKARCKFCVDTSPILEKSLAVRAGLGWQGKHSVVIHPENGSFFVLGEIITDLEIEPDKPMSNQCGDCTRCIDACPTKAILEPFILDTKRCLSYLTIEHKGPISGEFQKNLKSAQYGCDICQEVCPYNNRAAQSSLVKG